VGREILDGPYGTPGSITIPATAGSVQTHYYSYTLPADWVFEKLQFVGLLMDNTTGEILNANNVVYWLGENELTKSIDLKVFPNPFSSIASATFRLDQPQDVKVRMLDMLGRSAYTAKTRHYPAGDNTIRLDGSSLENGLYIVELTIGKETYTKKVSLNK
jgi:hypothetical protein